MNHSAKKVLLWAFLLNKRLFRKPLFLLLLCLIPLFGFLAGSSKGQASLLTVGVCAENRKDPLSRDTIRLLLDRKDVSVVRYREYASEGQLRSAVEDGTIRVGFLLPEKLSDLFASYAKMSQDSGGSLGALGEALGLLSSSKASPDQTPIQVLCARNDIVTKLEKDHFFGTVYGQLEKAVLKAYLDQSSLSTLVKTDREAAGLLDDLGKSRPDGSFFHLTTLSHKTLKEETLTRYDLTLLRGLLAISLLLLALAACLFLNQDQEKGLFVWLRPAFRPLFYWLYLLLPALDGGFFVALALLLLGQPLTGRQVPAFLLYLVSVVGFSNLVRLLTRRSSFLAAAIPPVILGCLFLTPVFFDLRVLPALQMVLPTYSFLKCLTGSLPLSALLVYALLVTAASLLADRWTCAS